jgi:riboflavin kinase/FMN adenylyltransferase
MTISGPVIKGLGIGKKLGSPTINLDPVNAPKDLKHGVYVVTVKTPVGNFLGAMHYGPRPSIPNAPISLEVYCIGLNEDLYEKTVEIEVKKRLRDIKKFANLEDLKKQIDKDIDIIRSHESS